MGKVYGVNGLCKTLDISRPTALNLLQAGTIRAGRLSKRGPWIIAESEIERFLRGGVEVSGGAEKAEAIEAA